MWTFGSIASNCFKLLIHAILSDVFLCEYIVYASITCDDCYDDKSPKTSIVHSCGMKKKYKFVAISLCSIVITDCMMQSVKWTRYGAGCNIW